MEMPTECALGVGVSFFEWVEDGVGGRLLWAAIKWALPLITGGLELCGCNIFVSVRSVDIRWFYIISVPFCRRTFVLRHMSSHCIPSVPKTNIAATIPLGTL